MTSTFTPDEIAALIAKLEALNGPNFAVENEICETLGLAPEGFEQNAQGGWTQYVAARDDVQIWRCPAYTYSLDAAARLIPEGLYWIIGYGKAREAEPLGGATIYDPADFENPISEGEAPTVAIALCIAALKARASIRASGTRPTGQPGATRPPAHEASGPVGRDSIEGGLS